MSHETKPAEDIIKRVGMKRLRLPPGCVIPNGTTLWTAGKVCVVLRPNMAPLALWPGETQFREMKP